MEKVSDKLHVIWDWNGTILDDVDHAIATINSILAKRNMKLLDKLSYRQTFGFPIKDYYDKLGFDYTNESFEEISHEFVEKFMDGVKECKLFQTSLSAISNVNKMGITQSVLSASDQESLSVSISHFKLDKFFDQIFGISNKLAASKLYRGEELIANSRFSKSKTILIGDTLHDLEVGQALGVEVILLDHGHQCGNRLRHSYHDVLTLLGS